MLKKEEHKKHNNKYESILRDGMDPLDELVDNNHLFRHNCIDCKQYTKIKEFIDFMEFHSMTAKEMYMIYMTANTKETDVKNS
jgi:hypothetical protein